MLGDMIRRIALAYPADRRAPFAGHPAVALLRRDAPAALRDALGRDAAGLRFRGSAGLRGWAEVPWVGVFDPAVTTSATRGYYVDYLFAADLRSVVLSFGHGAVAVRQTHGARAPAVLRERAALIRARLPEHAARFSSAPIDLRARGVLARDYEASVAFARTYATAAPPPDGELARDLRAMVALYRLLTRRGGLDSPDL
jgi:5-methylcytosine-specific restriction enzyme A